MPRPAVRKGATRACLLLAGAALAVVGTLTGCATTNGTTVADAGYEAGDGSFRALTPGERHAPLELTGETFEGEAIDLAEWRGDVTVLNFWYAACPPCRVEAPDLAEIAADYAGDGVRLLGVNSTDDAATVAAFNTTFGIDYPSLDDRDARAVAALEGLVPLRAMPSTVVLDRAGRPAAVVVGRADASTLRGLIDDALAEG